MSLDQARFAGSVIAQRQRQRAPLGVENPHVAHVGPDDFRHGGSRQDDAAQFVPGLGRHGQDLREFVLLLGFGGFFRSAGGKGQSGSGGQQDTDQAGNHHFISSPPLRGGRGTK